VLEVLADGAEAPASAATAPSEPEALRLDGVVEDNTPTPVEATADKPEAKDLGDIDWKEYYESYSNDWQGGGLRQEEERGDDDERRPVVENFQAGRPELTGHLLWQIRLSGWSENDITLAELIVGNLDRDGYLQTTVEELSDLADVGTALMLEILKKMQELD